MKKLFGTDGIRGVANQYPMTPEMAMKIGTAVACYVKERGGQSIVIGRDTRISGEMLESALAAGITSVGVDVFCTGVIPTPGVAFLSSDIEGAGAGIVISASHNPWQDNGIKIFKREGHKLLDEEEESLESLIADVTLHCTSHCTSDTGRILYIPDAVQRYCHFLKNTFPPLSLGNEAFNKEQNSEMQQDSEILKTKQFSEKTKQLNEKTKQLSEKIKLVIDCSNGAASSVAPSLFTAPFFDAHFIHHHPDGKNINDNCGSQHTETLAGIVLEHGADLGLAFDGDADRLIAIDETGSVITGDRILAVCAAHAKLKGTLEKNLVVSTVMSNIGLARTLDSLGIEHLITGVGDREVLKEMAASGAVMGGEDSGHMIFSQYHTTGDGLLTALRLIEVIMETGKPLSELAAIMKVYPQVLMNVEVDSSRPDFMAIREIADEIRSVEEELGKEGRVLVRYSGTQPLLRVMVEGADQHVTETCCWRICETIRQVI